MSSDAGSEDGGVAPERIGESTFGTKVANAKAKRRMSVKLGFRNSVAPEQEDVLRTADEVSNCRIVPRAGREDSVS